MQAYTLFLSVLSSPSRFAPSCATFAYIHGGPNSVIKRNWFRAAFRKNRMLPPIETSAFRASGILVIFKID